MALNTILVTKHYSQSKAQTTAVAFSTFIVAVGIKDSAIVSRVIKIDPESNFKLM